MGRPAPFAFPNTRRPGEATTIGTGWPGSHPLVASLAFGLPVLVQTVGVTAQGVGAGVVTPQGVGLASVRAEGAGSGLVTPQGVALAAVRAEGAVQPRVTPQGVVLARVAALGEGSALVDADVVFAGSSAAVRAEGAALLSLETVTLRPTLLDKLGPRIAGLRATLTKKIGDRPYRVYLVTTTWSGGEPGRGEQARVRVELGCGVDRKTGLVQPPKIEASSPLSRPKWQVDRRGMSSATGAADLLYLTQVDPTLVERDFVTFADLDRDQEAYVEIEHVGARGGVGAERPVRRYRIAQAPQFDAIAMQWIIGLQAQEPSKSYGGPRLG